MPSYSFPKILVFHTITACTQLRFSFYSVELLCKLLVYKLSAVKHSLKQYDYISGVLSEKIYPYHTTKLANQNSIKSEGLLMNLALD